MIGYLYFTSNFKDIRDHIGLYNELQNIFTTKNNSFQGRLELVATLVILK